MADSQLNVRDAIGELKDLVQAEIKRSEELSDTSAKLHGLSEKMLALLSSIELRFAELEARVAKLEQGSAD